MQATGKRDMAASERIWSVIKAGPVAQLMPIHSSSRCASEVYKASTSCPASRVPIGSTRALHRHRDFVAQFGASAVDALPARP